MIFYQATNLFVSRCKVSREFELTQKYKGSTAAFFNLFFKSLHAQSIFI